MMTPTLLSFFGETKQRDGEVDLMVMGYDTKNPAIKSALRRCGNNSVLIGSYIASNKKAYLGVDPGVDPNLKGPALIAALNAGKLKRAQESLPWVPQASAAIDWKHEAANYAADAKKRLYPPLLLLKNDGTMTDGGASIAYVRQALANHPEVDYYFDSHYPLDSSDPDSFVINMVKTNPLLWQMVASGNLGTPDMTGGYMSQKLQSKGKFIDVKSFETVGAVVAAVATGKGIASILQSSKSTSPAPVLPTLQALQSASLQKASAPNTSTKAVSSFRIWIKKYFGL